MDNATAAAPLLASVDLDLIAYDIADVLDRGDYGLDLTQDDIRAGLAEFLATALAHARKAATDPDAINPETNLPHRFDDAPRTKATRSLRHTCNPEGANPDTGLPFGRKAPETCARCYDMVHNGAPARVDYAAGRRDPGRGYLTDAERAQHRATCTACQTGGVCTAGQW